MRRMLLLALTVVAVGCGPSPQGAQEPSAGARDARRDADRGVVAGPESGGTTKAPSYACGDTVLSDQSTSGGQPLTEVVPCTPVDMPSGAPKPTRIHDAESGEAIPEPAPAPMPSATPPKKQGPAIQAPG